MRYRGLRQRFILPSRTAIGARANERKSMVLLGGGQANYSFPNDLAERCCAKVNGDEFVLQPTRADANEASLESLRPVQGLSLQVPAGLVKFAAAPASASEPSALRRSAQAYAHQMTQGIFTQPIDGFFRQDYLLVTRDKQNLPEEMHSICDSLAAQIAELRKQVTEALPAVMDKLHAKYPQAHTAQLYESALHLIAQELLPILTTLQLWTTGFRQWLDPELEPKLRMLRAKIEQKLWLVLTGNLRLDLIEDSTKVTQLLQTIKLVIGDVIVPVLIGPFDSGPAVIPIVDGTVGPQGGHLMFYPWNMLDSLTTSDPIYDHEVGHLLMSIIKGFEKEFSKMIVDGLDKAYAAGEIKFSTDFVKIGQQSVPSLNFLKMVFLNQIGELVADLFGCLIGGAPAFASCFGTYIGAMTSLALGGMEQVDHILRNSSSYTVEQKSTGRLVIHLEPHPQDNVRCGNWQRDIADGTDFGQTARWLEDLCDTESGTPKPLTISWVGEMPQEGAEQSAAPAATDQDVEQHEPELPLISLNIADFAQGSKVLTDYLLNTPAACLNGMSIKQLVCLTPQMQEQKVEPLKKLLKGGIGRLPADNRHYYLHHVGSAATLAFDELVAEGVDADEALTRVNKAGELMMAALVAEWEKMVQALGVYNLNAKQVLPRRRTGSRNSTAGGSKAG